MAADMTRRARRNAWHIDRINDAPDAGKALQRVWEWLTGELDAADDQRPEDAAGFRWQFVEDLAQRAMSIRGHHPDDRFRNLNGMRPRLTGGGWTAKPPKENR